MSIRWERFAGDTSSFAARLAFHRDPDDGEAATPEMAESWGAFQLWVRGRNLCAHIDQGVELNSCYWYLLPLLEWLSANWDPLFHEERPPEGKQAMQTASDVSGIALAMTYAIEADESQPDEFTQQYDWRERHTLRAARQGGIFPDVRLRRFRDHVEVAWAAHPMPGAEDVHFMSPQGAHYLRPLAVAQPLYEVLASAAAWLHQQLPDSSRCSALVAAVEALTSDQRTEERIAWLARLGTDRDQMKSRWRRVRSIGESMAGERARSAIDAAFRVDQSSETVIEGSCTASLLFGSTSPTIDDSDVRSLTELLLNEYERSPVDGMADVVVDESIDRARHPWEHGYELAAELLEEFEGDGLAPADRLEMMLRRWNVRVRDVVLHDRSVRAVSFVSANHAPTIALNRSHATAQTSRAQRFTLAHELCHLLHDRSYGVGLAIASGPWAPSAIEQRANAFAAWLLMPPERLREVIAWAPGAFDTHRGIKHLSYKLDVSRAALVWHLHNLGFLSEEKRMELMLHS
ncbi:ImmA/IrrE family metallo-endopeptidase [Candidatus Poriferisodalis sp.]|uniref:ImmA/IrrE family metallo-endopeptidase n=1 Tax=Candidatus Poriferisodalis sp. TaxID=3101277 RepID=UPI003B011B99